VDELENSKWDLNKACLALAEMTGNEVEAIPKQQSSTKWKKIGLREVFHNVSVGPTPKVFY
jgi:type II secretory pathway component GspD/PulD (secretin)